MSSCLQLISNLFKSSSFAKAHKMRLFWKLWCKCWAIKPDFRPSYRGIQASQSGTAILLQFAQEVAKLAPQREKGQRS